MLATLQGDGHQDARSETERLQLSAFMNARSLSSVSGQTRAPDLRRVTISELPTAFLPKYEDPIPVSDRNTSISANNPVAFFMNAKISSKADMSSVLYEGRAVSSEIEDISGMKDSDWRQRLTDAVKASGKSKRAISIAAGMGVGYVHSILSEGKDPTIDPLLKICEQIGVSLPYIIYGYDVSPEDEEFLHLLSRSTESDRAAILSLLRNRADGNT